MIEKMRLYYIAYRYSDGQVEMMCGPYGTGSEADSERNLMLNGVVDDKLIVVRQEIEVKEAK